MPDTFNDETNVVLFDNVVIPDTFNDDIHVVEPFNVDVRDTFKLLVVNVDGFVKLLIYVNNVVDVLFKLSIFNLLKVDNEFKLLKMVVDVAFKLVIDNVQLVDKLFTFVFVAKVEPLTVNDDDKTVALVVIKWYELTSYNPELFILEFIYYIYIV